MWMRNCPPSVGQLIIPCQRWERKRCKTDAYSALPISTKLVGGWSVDWWGKDINRYSKHGKNWVWSCKDIYYSHKNDGTQVLTLFWLMSLFTFPQSCFFVVLLQHSVTQRQEQTELLRYRRRWRIFKADLFMKIYFKVQREESFMCKSLTHTVCIYKLN